MELWIAPIFALIGTVIGGFIPAITTIMTNKATTKQAKIETHEAFIRKIMIEFVRPSWVVYNATDNTFAFKDFAKVKIKSVKNFYEMEIIKSSPLELLELSLDITNIIERLDFALDSGDKVKPETKQKALIALNNERKRLKKKLTKLENKINRNFM